MPIFPVPIPSSILQLGTMFAAVNNNSPIYLYKDSNGNIMSSSLENSQNENSFGYAFQFINSEIIYTTIPITNYQNVPWLYPGATTLGSMWNDKLMLWIDAKDARTFNVDTQKLLSKSYTTDLKLTENTTNYSFTHSNNAFDLTSGANIETSQPQLVYQYFKLAMVVTIPTQNVDNYTIYKHNRLEIKVTNGQARDQTNQFMIGLFDNGSLCKSISFKPTDPDFKYYIYCDNQTNFYISQNGAIGPNGNFFQNTSQKVFISGNDGNPLNGKIKLYELLLFQSTTNNILTTESNIWTYLSTRWGLTTYIDLHNIAPYPALVQPTFSGGTNQHILNTTYSYNPSNNIITCLANVSAYKQNNCLMLDKYFTSTTPGTIFVCIEFMNNVVDIDQFYYGFIKSSNGTTVSSRLNSYDHVGYNSAPNNGAITVVQNYAVVQGYKTFININYLGAYESYPEWWTTNYSYVAGTKMTFSFNTSNRNVIVRLYNESNTLIFSIERTPAAGGIDAWFEGGGMRYYPHVVWWDNNGTQFKFNKDFEIPGETNVFLLNDGFYNIPPSLTSWTSPYSSGIRSSIITITKSVNLVVNGNIQGMIDNSNLFNNQNAWWFNNENVTNKFIQFELSVPQIIDAFQIVGDNRLLTVSLGTHLFQASNNGSTWTTLKEFNWVGNTAEFNPITTAVPVSGIVLQNPTDYLFSCVNVSFTNNLPYKYYRTLGVSGTDSSNPYQTEILFKASSF